MTQHIVHKPVKGRTFKLGFGWYNLSHSYGYWRLVRVSNGVLHTKPELSSKNLEAILNYLAQDERCTVAEARSAYDSTQTAV